MPEISDYVSFIGFLICYVSNLRAMTSSDLSPNDSGATLSPIPSTQAAPCLAPETLFGEGMRLILGGYSYGSLIATLLPDTESIMNRFTNVTTGSAEAEIRLRALHLSTQWNKDALARRRSQRDQFLRSQEKAIVMGGEESDPWTRRPSRDSRRSIDTIRKSVDFGKRKLCLRHTSSGESEVVSLNPALLPNEIPLPKTSYLLISPLRPPISSFMTMFFRARLGSPSLQGRSTSDADSNLITNSTLVVYGDKDFFASPKKLRKWVEHLSVRAPSTCQFREIAGAGHFWQEEGVEVQLRASIGDWVKVILNK